MPPPHWQTLRPWSMFIIVAALHTLVALPCHTCLGNMWKICMPPFVDVGLVAKAYDGSFVDSNVDSCTLMSSRETNLVAVQTSVCNGVPFVLGCPPKQNNFFDTRRKPYCKSIGVEDFDVIDKHFAMAPNHLQLHIHPPFFIDESVCLFAMDGILCRWTAWIAPCLLLQLMDTHWLQQAWLCNMDMHCDGRGARTCAHLSYWEVNVRLYGEQCILHCKYLLSLCVHFNRDICSWTIFLEFCKLYMWFFNDVA